MQEATLKPVRSTFHSALPALAVVLVGIVAIVAGVAGNSGAGARPSAQAAGTNPLPAQSADPWPAFVMVFHDEFYNWETGHVVSAEDYRYTYNGRENWQLELLASNKDLRAVGSRTEYNNATFTEAGRIDGQPLPVHTTKADKPYMATWWLVPVAVEQLEQGGDYQRAAAVSDGKIRLYKDETLPCQSLSAEWQTRLCGKGQQSYRERTEKLLEAKHGIPLEITGKTEGKVTFSTTVKQLTYTNPSTK
ncbi:MAG: hypothetical protein M3Z04_18880 [Chloroflexota bacterium]|nr:hypothetical protein [Chloroflexota bacterium]